MGLQVRLKHALGERLFDLQDRPVENPLVIGRAREADIKVPSVTVSGQHGALFVHEGQWFVQDTSGGRATWVNGNSLEGPTPLCVGDTIVIGSDAMPVTIEVDPAGVDEGRTGEPVYSSEPAPPAARRATLVSTVRDPVIPPPAHRDTRLTQPPTPPGYATATATDPWGNPSTGEDSIAGWDQPAAATADAPVESVRRRKKSGELSQTAMMLGIGVCVAIVGITGWAVYVETRPAPPPAASPSAPRIVYGKSSSSVFSEHQEGDVVQSGGTPAGGETPAPAPKRAAPPPAPAPDQSSDPTETPATPSEPTSETPSDADWAAVLAAENRGDIGNAILQFDDYARQHKTTHVAEVNEKIESALDRLWWKRIGELCAQRDEKSKAVQEKDKEIRQQPAGPFQNTLKDEKKDLDKDLAQAQKGLVADMGYTSQAAPNPDDPGLMSKLTAGRDVTKYSEWKKQTLRFIRIHHGTLPWAGG